METKEYKQAEPLYKEKIDVQEYPVLEPILKLNKEFMNWQTLINQYNLDYERIKEDLENAIFPEISATGIVFEAFKLVDDSKRLKDLFKQRQEMLKGVILEMIKIVKGEPFFEEEDEKYSEKERSEDWEIKNKEQKPKKEQNELEPEEDEFVSMDDELEEPEV